MMHRRPRRAAAGGRDGGEERIVRALRRCRLLGLIAMACCVIVACGDSDSSRSGASQGDAGATSSGIDLQAAKAVVDKLSAGPTAFPVDTPLERKPAAGEKFAYLECGAPFCALLGELVRGGARALGTPVETVKADNSTASIQAALSSIRQMDPAALLLPAVNLGALGTSLKTIAAGVPVVGNGVQGDEKDGLSAALNGPNNIRLAGRVLANWAIVNVGEKREIVYYDVPELDFSVIEREAFEAELDKNCSVCKLRAVNIPLAATGTTAPSRVVSDLQAHPDTEVAIFSSIETATGLAAALKSAGIKVKVNGFGPTPTILQDIKSGGLSGALGLDVAVMAFTSIDAMARLATDPSKGWSGYPDFAQRFAKLWAPARD
jgi:ribose transport system substrate-binding protein